jgi:hypothetical protein
MFGDDRTVRDGVFDTVTFTEGYRFGSITSIEIESFVTDTPEFPVSVIFKFG